MPVFRDRPPLPQDPLYRAILWVLVGSTAAATLLSLALQANNPPLSRTAGWAALVFAGLYLFFRFVGPRWRAPKGDED